MRTRRVRVWLAVVAGMCAVVFGGTSAWAYWTSSASTNASVAADSLPQGATPTTAVSGATVTVTFSSVSTAQRGVTASGYMVKRYSVATGGTAVTLACTSSPCSDVPGAGTWYYTDTPLLGANWQGAESARSAGQAVAFGPPTKLAFTQQPSSPTSPNTAFATQPQVTVEDAAGNAVLTATNAVTLALTTANGATLSCSANPANASVGVATFSGCQVSQAGTYTLTATASGLSNATSNQFTIASQAAVTSLSLANGGTAKVADQGDSVTITFATAMDPTRFCAGWTSTPWSFNTFNTGASVQIVDSGSNDKLTVSGPTACPTFNLGTVTLGADYVGSTATFNGNGNGNAAQVVLSSDGRTLTITLGKPSSGTAKTSVSTGTPTYTPAPGLADTQGNALPATTYTGTPSGF